MHHLVTEMCTCVHISVTKWCIVGYETGALWDLWDWSIAWFCCGLMTSPWWLQKPLYPYSSGLLHCEVILKDMGKLDWYYIMAGHAIVVVKDITLLFYNGNAVILTLWWWLNDGKWLVWCKFNYINNHLWLVKNNNQLKPRYTEPCNFLTKRAWVSQQCTLVVAKDSNILHYLNSWAYLVMIILAII